MMVFSMSGNINTVIGSDFFCIPDFFFVTVKAAVKTVFTVIFVKAVCLSVKSKRSIAYTVCKSAYYSAKTAGTACITVQS